MDITELFVVLIFVLAIAGAAYKAVVDANKALGQRRAHQELAATGVRAHGVVTAVHPLERRPEGHRVTVRVRGANGYQWDVVDDSGLGGYLVREGTPVELVHASVNPMNIRVDRAAPPNGYPGGYAVHRDGTAAARSLVGSVLLNVGLLAFGAVVLWGTFSNDSGTDEVVGYFPLVFILVGLVMLFFGVRSLRDLLARRAHTAETTGVVTDVWRESSHRTRNNRRLYNHPFTVHFRTADGREVHHRHPVASSSFRPVVNQRLRVRHDPAHPVRYSLPDQWSLGFGVTAGFLFAGGVFTLLGALFTPMIWASGG